MDACICGCPPFALYLKRILSDPRRDDLPVYIREPIRHRSMGGLETALSMAGCSTLTRSNGDLRDRVQAISDLVSPAVLRKILGNAIEWRTGHDLDLYDTIAQKATNSPVLFLGNVSDRSMARRILALYRGLYATGLGVTVVSTDSMSVVNDRFPDNDRSYVSTLKGGVDYREYLSYAGLCGIFVSLARDDSNLAVSNVEIQNMLMGQIGILPKTDYTIRLLDRDYPFLYTDESAAMDMAAYIHESYDSARKKISKYRGRLRDKFGWHNTNVDAWSAISAHIKKGQNHGSIRSKRRSDLFGTIQRVAEGLGDKFRFDVFLDVLEENATWIKPWGYKGAITTLGKSENLPTQYDIIEALGELGWTDMCDGEIAFMKRTK